MLKITLSTACIFFAIGIIVRSSKAPRTVSLKPESPTVIHVIGDEVVRLTLSIINDQVSHVVFQSHSQWDKLRLSQSSQSTYSNTAKGTCVGVLQVLQQNQISVSAYLSLVSNNNDTNTAQNTTVIVSAWVYLLGDPFPGGCSTEFPMAVDPNVLIDTKDEQNMVRFQYGATGRSKRKSLVSGCEDKTKEATLTYDVYQHYMDERDQTEDHFISATKDMLNITTVQKIGRKIKTIKYRAGKTALSFSSHRGIGTIYTVIVNQLLRDGTSRSALYVTGQTYSCQKGECETEIYVVVVAAVLGVLGLFLCFFGHRCFKTAMFLFGFFAFCVVFYALVGRFTDWSDTAKTFVPLSMAIFGGLLWLSFWAFCGIPVLSVLLAGLVMGFIVSSVLFSYTPLGFVSWWSSPFNYGMVFSCGVLLLPVFILACTRFLHIVSCAIVGSYLTFYAIDKSLLSGSFQSIIDISLRKAIIPDYIKALPTNPIQKTDIILLCCWVLLCILGFGFQWVRERNRPEFPPCPWRERQFRRRREECSRREPPLSDDEEEPLLAAHRQLLPSAPPEHGQHPYPAQLAPHPRSSPPPAYNTIEQHPNIVRIQAPPVEPL